MRLLVLSLFASALCAQVDFVTGMGARLVIGQQTFTAQDEGASSTLLGGVSGLAYRGDMLFVTDANRVGATPLNHRVLIYKNLSQMLPALTDELPQGKACNVCVGEATVVLGQSNFEDTEYGLPATASSVRRPIGVATDGVRVAVADTDNNRVLIWNSVPNYYGQPADVVLGQPNFESVSANKPDSPGPQTMRGPQGVWFQGDRLFVADTANHRVLIWQPIPTTNHAPATVVIGRKDFTDFIPPDNLEAGFDPQPNNLLSPTSVTSDGQRLYVSDLGHNRVLIWNSIPTQNAQSADLVIGQPDLQSGRGNNSPELCEAVGQNEGGQDIFPVRCSATLDFPRFALSDGERLFVADGGNDRVLIFNQIPTENGAAADVILGQPGDKHNLITNSENQTNVAEPGRMRTPSSLAWDGLNLYVSDPYNRRVLVFTMAEPRLGPTSLRNAASFDVFAIGLVTLSGTASEGDEVTVTVQEDREYTYTVQEGDTLADVAIGLADAINADEGDPDLLALPNSALGAVVLTSKIAGPDGNEIAYSVTTSDDATVIAVREAETLEGGGEASRIAPGTIISIVGEALAEETVAAPYETLGELPREMGGAQVYLDGILAPLYYVSPTQINAQMPAEFGDRQGVSAYVRTSHADGAVTASNAVSVPIVLANPGIFAEAGVDPRPAIAVHATSHATAAISVDGIATEDQQLTVTIGPEEDERVYTYTTLEEDVSPEPEDETEFPDYNIGRENIRRALIALINEDPEVEALPAGQFQRIILRARQPGPEYEGIPISVDSGTTTDGIILSATVDALCCANEAGAPVTADNPVVPGEIFTVYATGLGLVDPEEARDRQITGVAYDGPELNTATEFVSSLLGGLTAHVLFAGLQPGSIGLYRVDLQALPSVTTNPLSNLTIAQGYNVSNIVTVPVFNPQPMRLSTVADPDEYSAVGDVIDFTYTITNYESVTITGPIIITDQKIPSISCPEEDITPNGGITCEGVYVVTQADIDAGEFSSVAYATGLVGERVVTSRVETETVKYKP